MLSSIHSISQSVRQSVTFRAPASALCLAAAAAVSRKRVRCSRVRSPTAAAEAFCSSSRRRCVSLSSSPLARA